MFDGNFVLSKDVEYQRNRHHIESTANKAQPLRISKITETFIQEMLV